MDRELAQDILLILNTPKIMNVLEKYANAEMAKWHLQIENAQDANMLFQIQGSIRALRRLVKIREDAIAVMGEGNGQQN